jgi:hypothetical protein
MSRHTAAVQEAFVYVLLVVVAVSVVVAVVTLVGSGRAWEQIGRGGLSLRDGTDRPGREPAGPPPSGPAAERERDEEIRQLLEARSARRVARGQPPLDVEAELRRLTAGPASADRALRDEVRQLVLARNERRVRQGRPPLDVEAEVERRLRDAGGT